MKFITSPQFDSHWKDFPPEHRELVKPKIPVFHAAAVAHVAHPGSSWPLRVRSMKGYPGLWEVTWNLKSPDLRGTFTWTEIDGQPGIAWVDIGDHSIY